MRILKIILFSWLSIFAFPKGTQIRGDKFSQDCFHLIIFTLKNVIFANFFLRNFLACGSFKIDARKKKKAYSSRMVIKGLMA